jgi:hypothetical protein
MWPAVDAVKIGILNLIDICLQNPKGTVPKKKVFLINH